mmetsp:Transcript_8081/g.18108  ORF Transcript_8081/g.18108 Transcript_8081/m.18108 type:complete len:109 (-) Transcript_8081:333-659(-)
MEKNGMQKEEKSDIGLREILGGRVGVRMALFESNVEVEPKERWEFVVCPTTPVLRLEECCWVKNNNFYSKRVYKPTLKIPSICIAVAWDGRSEARASDWVVGFMNTRR